MDAQATWDAIADRLRTPKIDVSDEVRESPGKPYYLLSVTDGIGSHQTIGARGRNLRQPVQVMAVNNSAPGCRFLIGRAIDLLDGWVLDGHPLVPDFGATHPYPEEGPGDFRWSSTAGFIHITRRTA